MKTKGLALLFYDCWLYHNNIQICCDHAEIFIMKRLCKKHSIFHGWTCALPLTSRNGRSGAHGCTWCTHFLNLLICFRLQSWETSCGIWLKSGGKSKGHMGGSTNGTPKSSVFMGFSMINQPFWIPFLETLISSDLRHLVLMIRPGWPQAAVVTCHGEAHSMSMPCSYQVYPTFIPCWCHVCAMFISCLCHVYATISTAVPQLLKGQASWAPGRPRAHSASPCLRQSAGQFRSAPPSNKFFGFRLWPWPKRLKFHFVPMWMCILALHYTHIYIYIHIHIHI